MTWHRKPKLKIAQQSRDRLAEKIRQTLQAVRGHSLEQTITRLNPILRVWVVYFRLTEQKGVLETLMAGSGISCEPDCGGNGSAFIHGPRT
jgi:RNA-directed DNA polymerase